MRNIEARIGCWMCHGVYPDGADRKPSAKGVRLTVTRFEASLRILAQADVRSLSYEDLDAWRRGQPLSGKAVLIDFDHPVRLIWDHARPLLARYGFKGNLFVNTAGIEAEAAQAPTGVERRFMTWDQVGELADQGWTIGCHTVHHLPFWEMAAKDPTGGLICAEIDEANETIERRLGRRPIALAYTGRSWSALAEPIVQARFRFARLWYTGRPYTVAPGQEVPEGEVGGFPGPAEADGGPPYAARYITPQSNWHRLPSLDLEYLLTTEARVSQYADGLAA